MQAHVPVVYLAIIVTKGRIIVAMITVVKSCKILLHIIINYSVVFWHLMSLQTHTLSKKYHPDHVF